MRPKFRKARLRTMPLLTSERLLREETDISGRLTGKERGNRLDIPAALHLLALTQPGGGEAHHRDISRRKPARIGEDYAVCLPCSMCNWCNSLMTQSVTHPVLRVLHQYTRLRCSIFVCTQNIKLLIWTEILCLNNDWIYPVMRANSSVKYITHILSFQQNNSVRLMWYYGEYNRTVSRSNLTFGHPRR